MTTSPAAASSATSHRPHPVDIALALLSPVVLVLSLTLHEYVQAGVVFALMAVAITKLRAPDAAWLEWKPRPLVRG